MNRLAYPPRYDHTFSAVVAAMLLLATLLLAGSAQSAGGPPDRLVDSAAGPSVNPFPASVDSIPAGWPQARVEAAFRSSPVMFIENVGQFDDIARFQVWVCTVVQLLVPIPL